MESSWVLWSLIGAGLLVVGIVAAGMHHVPEGNTHTVSRRGKFHRVLQPGWHFISPFLDRISHRVNMMGRALDVAFDQLHTRDDRDVAASGMVYFQVLDARKAAPRTTSLDDATTDLVANTARAMVEQMNLSSLDQHSSRELNAWLLGLLNQSATEWGVRITRVQIEFSKPAD